MKLYNLITQALHQMVQWFKFKKAQRPGLPLLDLNYDVLVEQQRKNYERLDHFKRDTGVQVLQDIIYNAYQTELCGVHRVSHTDQYGFARHLGRVETLGQLIKTIEYVKQRQVIDTTKKQPQRLQQKRSEHNRPII